MINSFVFKVLTWFQLHPKAKARESRDELDLKISKAIVAYATVWEKEGNESLPIDSADWNSFTLCKTQLCCFESIVLWMKRSLWTTFASSFALNKGEFFEKQFYAWLFEEERRFLYLPAKLYSSSSSSSLFCFTCFCMKLNSLLYK